VLLPRARALAVGASILALALAGCSSGGSAAPSGAPSSAAPVETGPAMTYAAVGGGSCAVQVSGNVTSDWQRPQDSSSVLVSYWLSAAEREMLGQEGESFLVNCDGGDKGYLNLNSPTGSTVETFPKASGTYEIAASNATEQVPGTVNAMITLPGEDLWAVAAPGKLEVSRLDGSRFTATFEFPVGRWQPGAAEGVQAEATVTGSFDFACTSGGCN